FWKVDYLELDPVGLLIVVCGEARIITFPLLGPAVENRNLLGKKISAIGLVDCCPAWSSEGYVVETDTFAMIPLSGDPLGTLGNDYSGPLLLPFYHTLRFEDFGKAEAA